MAKTFINIYEEGRWICGEAFDDTETARMQTMLARYPATKNYTAAVSTIPDPISPDETSTSITSGTLELVKPVSRQTHAYSGRLYCYGDDRWVTMAHDNYGSGNYNWNHSGGTSTNPDFPWDSLGEYVPAGTKVKKFTVYGRTNNTAVSEIEFIVQAVKPNTAAAWNSGVDNDSEITTTEVFRDNYWSPSASGQPTFTGNTNDLHKRTFDLDYTVADDSLLIIGAKPTVSGGSTRYFYCNIQIEVERP